MNKIAENIEKLRNSLGLSRAKIARDLDLPQKNFDNYASGKFEPDADMLMKIANYFGVTLDFLYGNIPELLDEFPPKITSYGEALKFLTIDMKCFILKLPEEDVVSIANSYLIFLKGVHKIK